MKDRSFISSVGILLYVLVSVVDRFFYKLPNFVYIPLAVLGIVIIVAGFIIDKNRNR